MNPALPESLFRELAKFDSCSIANAVDSFGVRLLNEGFTGPGLICRTGQLPPMVGIAVTLKVRSAEPPMKPSFYLDQPDWWERLEEAPYPRVLIIEDTDPHPGRGAMVGPVHACIIKAMGFAGVATSGSVRGTDKFSEIGLSAFAAHLSPAHAYGHVIEIGGPVTVAGIHITSGALVHGDANGLVSIPTEIAERVPEAARQSQQREHAICQFCHSREFSRATLRAVIRGHAGPS